MTTARQVITSALTTYLNRLAPGETLDNDLGAVALVALNELSDEISGGGFSLFRTTIFSASGLTGTSFPLAATWPGLDFGQDLDAAVYNNGSFDYPIARVTMEQYLTEIRLKSLSGGYPQFWAYDNAGTVYFYPSCVGITIKILAKESLSNFADLDTDYSLPQGYQQFLAVCLAERLGPSVVGGVPPSVASMARAARNRIHAQNLEPAIIGEANSRGNIFTGFR